MTLKFLPHIVVIDLFKKKFQCVVKDPPDVVVSEKELCRVKLIRKAKFSLSGWTNKPVEVDASLNDLLAAVEIINGKEDKLLQAELIVSPIEENASLPKIQVATLFVVCDENPTPPEIEPISPF